jgi:hypothetical protein
MTRVRFLKPFVFADVITSDMTDYFVTFNANSQTEGYINDDLFTVLDGQGLVIDLDA